MAKRFPMQHRIGGFWLVVEGHPGTAPDSVLLSLREDAKGARRPGPRVAFENPVGRAQLLALAYDLIDVAEAMLPETAMNTSEVIGKGGSLPIPRNKRFADGVHERGAFRLRVREEGVMAAFARIQARMPILQRTQRVLEQCDPETAHWIEDALIAIQRTGQPSVFAWTVPPAETPATRAASDKPGLLARLAALTRRRPMAAAAASSGDPNDAVF